MRALLLAALLCACSSSAPATYRQGAPMAPMAPAFSPVEDAPHTLGQPGYVGEPRPVERSPHTRTLPPTKEPGVWAGDDRGSAAIVNSGGYHWSREATLWGYGLALPPGADPTLEVARAKMCVSAMRKAMDLSGRAHSDVLRLRVDEWMCVAARLYLACATRAERDARSATSDEDVILPWRNLRVAAAEDVKRRCAAADRTPSGQALEEGIRARLPEATESTVRP